MTVEATVTAEPEPTRYGGQLLHLTVTRVTTTTTTDPDPTTRRGAVRVFAQQFWGMDGRIDLADLLIAAMVDATCLYFSKPNEPVGSILRRSRRIFEKMGRLDEFHLDDQGCRVGYRADEGRLVADRGDSLQAGQALRWSPSVGSARSEDTIVIDEGGFEVVTEAQDWPRLTVSVNNPDAGSAVEELDVDYDAAPLDIGFNARYLLDITTQLNNDTALFKLADAGSPTLVQDRDGAAALYVLMPMRV